MKLGIVLAFAVGSALLTACAPVPMKPAEQHILAEEAPPAGDIPPPVQMAPILPRPKPTARLETYSVVVNNVRVQDLLFALARDAKLNVDVHPEISGSVTLNAIDQTLPQLLTRIARQVDMRYEIRDNTIVVVPDSPYLRTYRVDYLNMARDTQSDVTLSTSIGGSAVAGAGAAAGTPAGGGTQQTIKIRSNNHFWETLIGNIKDILRETDKVLPAQAAAPAAVAVAAPPQPSAPGQPAPPATATTVVTPPVPASTYVEKASVIANQEAGIITIRATGRQHEKIQEFLDQVVANASRQVLIEATVVEVRLNNEYQQGINWSMVARQSSGRLTINAPGGSSSPAGVTTDAFTVGLFSRGGNFSAVLRLLESFGTLKVLSSPKVSVLNNQTAMLRVVDNLVYFTVKSDISQNQNQTIQAFTTTVNPYAVGFVMSVTPQISDSDRVLVNVRPTITREIGKAIDPNPALVALNITNTVPLLQTRELESMLQIQSGQIAIMGGLMQDEVDEVDDGIPGVNRVPGVNQLFRQLRNTNRKTELVVFLRPTVVRDASIEGDFRRFRSLLPDENTLARPNPAKPPELSNPGSAKP
ncbi:MAG: type II and III secretion system protein [Betaproteobacteria bacterium]|nr:MAG: type II and III secretion system protein [Betaproteobacteria bacterium]